MAIIVEMIYYYYIHSSYCVAIHECNSYVLYFIVDLAQAVVDAGAVPLLVLCVQEPEISVKRIAASALSDIAKHSPEVSITKTILVFRYDYY